MLSALIKTDFARQLMAYAASEAAAKLSRLLVVIAVARTLSPEIIGIAAAALASGDILKALTENGVGQRIIAARDDALEQTCNTARRIFFLWCGGLFVLQLAIGAGLAALGHPLLGLLLALLAIEYLFMPAGLVQAALAMRAGKLRQTAAIAGGQVVGANVLTVVMAVLVPSPLALVLPRVLSAPVWLVLMRRLHPWTPQHAVGHAPIRPFLAYGWAVLGTEIVKVLRLQADKLVVGAVMGAETLGIYFMAFNAGLGLATSFAQALSVVLFPHLCASSDRSRAVRHSLGISLLMLAPVVALQAALAPVYVPLLLGSDWAAIAHVVSILCLAALPAVIWSAAAAWLRSEGRPETELAISALLALVLCANTALLAPHGLTVIAIGYLLWSTVIMLGAAWLVLPAGRAQTLVRI